MNSILEEPDEITRRMYVIILCKDTFEAGISGEIASGADISRKPGSKLHLEKRNISKEEVFILLEHSDSLLNALLKHYHKLR